MISQNAASHQDFISENIMQKKYFRNSDLQPLKITIKWNIELKVFNA